MTEIYYPEGFFVTTLSSDINSSTATIPLSAVPSRVTKGYAIIEPSSSSKREVIHFTSVGVNSITSSDDTTDGSDATGRGCVGSINVGANTAHDQGVTVLIAATEQYWKRFYDAISRFINPTTGDIDYTEIASALYAADAGANDTYAITLSPVPSAYSDILGIPISFKANTANTGACTLNVNSLGAITIKKYRDQDLADNDIEANQIVTVVYDGTNFQMQSQLATSNATQLNDTNGNEAIKTTATGSAVNEFTIVNAATGNAPDMQATGSDTNINMKMTPKGTGTFMIKQNAMARAYVGSAQNNISSGSYVKVQYNTTNYNPGSNFDTTNNRFTAPVTGVYAVVACVYVYDVVGDQKTYEMVFRKNGTATDLSRWLTRTSTASNNAHTIKIVDDILLTAGDYLEAFILSPDTGTDIEAASSTSYFSIHLVGV